MRDIFSFVELARSQKAQGLLLQAGNSPLADFIHSNAKITDLPLSVGELTGWLDSFLSPREKSLFKEKGFVSGNRVSGALVIKWQAVFGKDDMYVHFAWRDQQAEDNSKWELPAILNAQFAKESGLTLVVGPTRSGRTAFLQKLCKDLVKDHRRAVIYASPAQDFLPQAGVTRVSMSTLAQYGQGHEPPGYVVIDSSEENLLPAAIRIVEQGAQVIWTLGGSDVVSALRRVSFRPADGLYERLIEALQTSVAVRLIPAIEGGVLPVLEMIAMNSAVKERLQGKDFVGALSLVNELAERSGTRTLNQCLLNHLLKRKIDLKTGFAASLYPDELDAMLKKVGV